MTRVFLTAAREFKATALTKAFIFGAVILPALFMLVLGGAGALGLFSQQAEPTEGVIAVVDPTEDGAVAQRIAERLDPEALQERREQRLERAREAMRQVYGTDEIPGGEQALEQALGGESARIEVKTHSADDLVELKERVREGELLAVANLSEGTLDPGGEFELLVGKSAKARDIDLIEDAVANAVVDHRLAQAEMEPTLVRALTQRPGATTRAVTETGEAAGAEAVKRIVPLAFIVLLAMSIFTGGGYLLMSTVEEKASRIMEVLLSAISPMQLMTGKVLGQGMVGLALLGIYTGVGALAAAQFGLMSQIPPTLFVWLGVYFLMGYFIYAGINAAIGSAVNEPREAQTLQGPVMTVIILVIYLALFATIFGDNPHSTLARVLSFIPPATPFVMALRVAQIGDPPAMWELIATTVVGFAGMVGSVWIAAKIFRVGVLMYGQPPSLLGLIKWIRYA